MGFDICLFIRGSVLVEVEDFVANAEAGQHLGTTHYHHQIQASHVVSFGRSWKSGDILLCQLREAAVDRGNILIPKHLTGFVLWAYISDQQSHSGYPRQILVGCSRFESGLRGMRANTFFRAR